MKFLRRLFRKSPPKQEDPWEAAGKHYIAVYFRSQICEFVANLPKQANATIRFNPEQRCMEVVFVGGIVFAQFSSQGEFGTPYEVIVVTAAELDQELEDFFRSRISGDIKVEFKPFLKTTRLAA